MRSDLEAGLMGRCRNSGESLLCLTFTETIDGILFKQ